MTPTPRHSPVLLALVLSLGAYSACLLGHYLATASGLMADSYGLWSFARFVSTHRPAAIYDQQALLAYQITLGLHPDAWFPFGYPPPFLLLLAPLAGLPYWLAATCWSLTTLLLCLASVLAGRREPRLVATLLLLLAPSTAIGLIYGQTGFLFAAVLVGGMRLAERHPWLGGAVLGLLACKPQLAVLVPVALLAAGQGRALAAMLLSAAALMALAAAVYGPALCLAWPGALLAYAALFRAGSGPLWHLMPTLTAAATLLGLPGRLVLALQSAGAVLGVVLVWRSTRHHQPRALLTLAAATFLVSPYAFVYDLPLLTAAMLACLIDQLPTRAPVELALLAIVLSVPMLVLAGLPVGLVAVAAGLLLAMPAIQRPLATPTRFYPAATIG